MVDEEDEDPELLKLRAKVKKLAQKPNKSPEDYVKLGRLTLHVEDAEVGFTSPEAVEELDKLDDTKIRRLASMAIRFFDNCWTDRDRDLDMGVREVLGREGENAKMYGGGE